MYFLVENLRSALNALRGHLLRTILTMLSIAVGVATIIAIISIISGLDAMVAEEFSQMGTRILYISKHQWGGEYFWRAPQIGRREMEALERIPLAEHIVPARTTHGSVKREDNELSGIRVEGTDQDYHLVRGIPLIGGRFFTAYEAERGRHVCVLGNQVYTELFEPGENPVGKFIRIENLPFEVIGVIEKQGNFLTNMAHLAADNKVFIPLAASDRMFGRWRGITLMVSAPSEDLVDELAGECRMMLRVARGLKPGEPDNFGINKQDYMLGEFRSTTMVLWVALVGIAALSLLVGGVGIMNIMLISVTERTREIGVRKALGARRRHILLQFLLEAILVCWLGGLAGAAVGILFAFVVSVFTPLVFVLSWLAVGIGFAFTTLIGVFFGMYPAAKASLKSPVEAWRYE